MFVVSYLSLSLVKSYVKQLHPAFTFECQDIEKRILGFGFSRRRTTPFLNLICDANRSVVGLDCSHTGRPNH